MPERKHVERGDVWLVNLNGQSVPVVPVARTEALGVLDAITCVQVLPMVRNHVAEVELGDEDGLSIEGAVNADFVRDVDVDEFTQRLGRLPATKVAALDRALAIALGLR